MLSYCIHHDRYYLAFPTGMEWGAHASVTGAEWLQTVQERLLTALLTSLFRTLTPSRNVQLGPNLHTFFCYCFVKLCASLHCTHQQGVYS